MNKEKYNNLPTRKMDTTNCVDQDLMPQNAASDYDLQCLH